MDSVSISQPRVDLKYISKNIYSMEMIKFIAIFLFWLPFAAAANSTYEPCNTCLTRATPSVLARMSLQVYPNATIDQFKSVLVGDALDLCNSINASKPTVLYIFGWRESPDSNSTKTVVNAYLIRQDHNIILLDWREIASKFYTYPAFSGNGIGYTVAIAINKLVAAGCLNSSTLHVVGHSLGAQMCGFLARHLNFNLPRITGLDPAGPGFYVLIQDLTSADAEFVDIIHTDKGFYGTLSNTGTVNFSPNGGINPQPGCLLSGEPPDTCSHQRSWAYFAESLLVEYAFIGLQCNSYVAFKSGLCSSNTRVVMGYATPRNASGDFYLQTNSAAEYGRGSSGTTFSGMDALTGVVS